MASKTIQSDLALLVTAEALVPEADYARYEGGYRYGSGKALAVVRPHTTAEVSAIVRYCVERGVRIVPQGANTGLVAASTPDASGEQLVISLERLSRIQDIDPSDRSVTVEAGTRLSSLNAHVEPTGLFLPIDLGADPTIGGMIATNTGGARLLRYGDVQHNLLGLEAVVADTDGTIFSDMAGLRKDNSGIDLKQLFVGTAGCFGIITRAKLELHRRPNRNAAALVVPSAVDAVPAIIAHLENAAGEFLSACEGMSQGAMRAALEHHAALRNPFAGGGIPSYALLVELSSTSAAFNLDDLLCECLAELSVGDTPLVADALLGNAQGFWALRHSISDGLKASGTVIAFDIAVARSRFATLRTELTTELAREYPYLQVCDFGHCGDGGVHFNLVWSPDTGPSDRHGITQAVRDLVYSVTVEDFGGTFSAEHGVGPYNIDIYRRYASAPERRFAAGLKRLFDPRGVLGNVDFS